MSEQRDKEPIHSGWESQYRDKLDYDSWHWGSHCVDCYPGSCPMKVYVKDGVVVREEQAGDMPVIDPATPDFNPMGCQKGASWSKSLYGPDRLLYPIKRAGERGEGRWTRVTWDEALDDIADSMLDAIEQYGAHTIIREGSPELGSNSIGRFIGAVGGRQIDMNGSINDFSIGLYETFGKFSPVSSADDWFNSELVLIWHMNPVFTRIPYYHFIAEARYNGAEVVNISPDVNPSHVHADYQVTINGASDPAFGLAIVQVILDEKIADWKFIREQTDLGYLVRSDNQRYLRQTDVEGEGREDQMYQWDPDNGLKLADRGNLLLNGLAIALEGSFDVELHDGSTVQVRPALACLEEHLGANFTPEKQQPITSVHPDTIRMLARKVASKRTNIMLGYNACKFYHGDLIERAMCLVLAVSGNWGKHGTGIRCWAAGMHEGEGIAIAKGAPGAQATERVLMARDARRQEFIDTVDATATLEIAGRDIGRLGGPRVAGVPAFFWYDHCGYADRFNKREWTDDTLPRTFDEYLEEAITEGNWRRPPLDPPQILFECGGNMLRRTRGGKTALLDTLWPKLKKIVTIDFRISQTALYADYVLPAAQHYEKIGFSMPTPHVMHLNLSDKAAESPGEARQEVDIFFDLLKRIERRGAERGITEYDLYNGRHVVMSEWEGRWTMDGYYQNADGGIDHEKVRDEGIRDSVLAGALPFGMTLERLREIGHVRFTDFGHGNLTTAQASPVEPDKPHVPFRNHTEIGHPFPTYARRAQFYIDHPWFMEANEHMPTYKPNPKQGGDYPLGITSGHNRWSIHTMNQANEVILGTHRGEPNVMVNPDDARERGVVDDDLVRVYNDVGEFKVRVKIAPNVKPGQVISYNGWAGFQYTDWSGENEIEPGVVKWIGFASDYGHINYMPNEWQPVPASRWTRCDFEKVDG